MDQSLPGENPPYPPETAKAAEKFFLVFVANIQKAGRQGFIMETEKHRVYSFETWLRERSLPGEDIEAYCTYIRNSNFFSRAAHKMGKSIRTSNRKIVLKTPPWAMLAGLILYVLIATLLSIFGILIWNLTAMLLFAFGGAVAMLLCFGLLFSGVIKGIHIGKKKKAGGLPASDIKKKVIYMKIFDSDPSEPATEKAG